MIWVEKYRPQKIEDCVLPSKIKAQFQKIVDTGNCPNLLMSGAPGVGKTTIARALLNEIGYDYMIVNGSMDRNIDTLRNQITQYASSMSLNGTRKFVILDEADYLNPTSTQPALRNFIEEFSSNCGFILTCNYKSKIIEPLHSRCSVIDFKINKSDLAPLCISFLKRVEYILKEEGVEYDKKIVSEMIISHAPDWRRVLNELQRNSVSGKIDESTSSATKDFTISTLVEFLKKKDFDSIRKWCGENSDISSSDIFRKIYNNTYEFLDPTCVPLVVTTLADYQYKSAFVADQEINMVACLATIMMEAKFK
jgi:DNA polymerase III delta prime subunit